MKTEKAKNNRLKEKLNQLEKKENNLTNIQTELKTITDQKANVEKHLSGREVNLYFNDSDNNKYKNKMMTYI